MPRYDPPKSFKNQNIYNSEANNNSELVKDSQEEATIPKSNIDFNLYLRESKYNLNDVILSENTRKKIDLILAEIKYQELIYEEWGMAEKHKLDRALSINFSGLSGTGKTLTAEALASELKLKIIDVPAEQIESKWVHPSLDIE